MFKKRFIGIICLLLVAMLAMAGCSNNSGQTSTEGEPKEEAKKDTLVIGIPAEPKTLDPWQAESMGYRIMNQVFDYLIDQRAGKTEPGLAESWEYSEDNTEITFHLREGVKFHNGDIMTADDVAFSLNSAIAAPMTQEVTNIMVEANVVDDNTVVLKLKHPYGPIEECIASSQIVVVNKKAYESDPDGFGRNPVGTGPYKFAQWKSGDRIILERFDDYFKEPAAIKDVTFKFIVDSNTAVVALESGELDMLDSPSNVDRQNLIDNPDIEYYETEAAECMYVTFNHKDKLFSNQKLRQAIAHAVDKEAMVMGALEGIGIEMETPIVKPAFGWPEDFKNREYDLEKAKALMVEAGFPDGCTVTLKTMETPNYYKPTEILQDQLKQIGITANIVKLERGAFIEDLIAKRDYEICIVGTVAPYLDADHIYATYHSSMIDGGINYFNYDNKELDKLLDKGRLSTDQEERKQIYKDICEIFKEDAISVPLYTFMRSIAAHKDLKGVTPHPINRMSVYNYHWDN